MTATSAAAPAPAIAVVVPSYNRRGPLERVLGGLARQTAPAGAAFETVVVLDGGTDDSAAMLEQWVRDGRLPGLRWLAQPNSGQAAARNAGAAAARAPVLLFVDDDVVPEPELVARHLARHGAGERIAVLGDCELVRDPRRSMYLRFVWGWWEDLYHTRTRPARAVSYHDFCAGNVSLRRDDYLASGGFDPAFRGYGGEDYELGFRLLDRGVRFVPDRGARGKHYHRQTAAGVLRTSYQEGQADVLLGRKHPALRGGLRLMWDPTEWNPDERRYTALAFTERGMSPVVLRLRLLLLALYERLGLSRRWHRQISLLQAYQYTRGVRDALGSREALLAYRAEAPIPLQEVDVTHGLPEELSSFWVHGQSDLRVTAHGETLGTVHIPRPIHAPLREYLAELLATRFATPLWLMFERRGISPFGAPPASPAAEAAPPAALP